MKYPYRWATACHAGALAWILVTGAPGRADTAPPAPAPAALPAVASAPADAAPNPTFGEPARLSLEIKDADAEQVAQRLGAALGSEIRFDGPAPRHVRLKLEGATVREALDRAAAALGATWQRSFVFTQSQGSALPRALPTGLTVNLNLADASSQTAAIIAAKAAGGRLETIGALTGRVTLLGRGIPVEEAMDKIAQAAGVTWRTVYQFKIEAPAVIIANTEVKPGSTKDDPRIPSRARDAGTGNPVVRGRLPNMPGRPPIRFTARGRYAATTQATASQPTVYTCPMHPEIRSDRPGKCPKCGMDLRSYNRRR